MVGVVDKQQEPGSNPPEAGCGALSVPAVSPGLRLPGIGPLLKGLNLARDILTANRDVKAIYAACGPAASWPYSTPSQQPRYNNRQ